MEEVSSPTLSRTLSQDISPATTSKSMQVSGVEGVLPTGGGVSPTLSRTLKPALPSIHIPQDHSFSSAKKRLKTSHQLQSWKLQKFVASETAFRKTPFQR